MLDPVLWSKSNELVGLEEYRKNDSYWKFTQDLEAFAREIVRILSQYGDEPSQQAPLAFDKGRALSYFAKS